MADVEEHAEDRGVSVRRRSGRSDVETFAGLEDLEFEDDVGRVVAVLGGSARKGSWEPAAKLQVLALMGGVELDFREASLYEGDTVVEVLTIMGGVNIIVPPDVNVQASGTGLLGDFSTVSNHVDDADAPRLVIKGIAIMGGVNVKVKKLPLLKRLSSN